MTAGRLLVMNAQPIVWLNRARPSSENKLCMEGILKDMPEQASQMPRNIELVMEISSSTNMNVRLLLRCLIVLRMRRNAA